MKRLGRPLGLFKNLIDKIVFALAVILGLQIPNFIGQYRQRLGGHFDEASQNLKGFESISEETVGSTDLNALVAHYQQGSSDVQLIAEKLASDISRTDRLSNLVENLETAGIFGRLKHIVVDLERPIAMATIKDYQPGLPITPEAIMYALVFGILATLIFNWLLYLAGSITNTFGDKRDFQGYKIRERPDKTTKELLRGAKEPAVIFYDDSTDEHDQALTPDVKQTHSKRRGFEQISENIRKDLERDLEQDLKNEKS